MFTAARRSALPLRRPRSGFLAQLRLRRRMRREIAALRLLDDHLLDDIGITRALAEQTDLPEWDVPSHWRA